MEGGSKRWKENMIDGLVFDEKKGNIMDNGGRW